MLWHLRKTRNNYRNGVLTIQSRVSLFLRLQFKSLPFDFRLPSVHRFT